MGGLIEMGGGMDMTSGDMPAEQVSMEDDQAPIEQ
jgi:hypothetical protein